MMQDLERHWQCLENMYLGAPIHESYPGIRIKIGENGCEIELPVTERYFHAGQAMHGSVFFKLLDDSAFFAAQSCIRNQMLVTTQFTTQFIRPVAGGKLIATGELVAAGKQIIHARSSLINEQGKLVATGTGSFSRSRVLLDASIGYQC